MNIGGLCDRDVVAVPETMTVVEVAGLMRQHDIGDVLVLEPTRGPTRPVGIVTDRDIVVEVVAAGIDAGGLRVGDLLLSPQATVHEDETCEDTVRLMALHHVCRMPVVDRDGSVVGVIRITDLLPYFAAPLARLSHLAARERTRGVEIPL